MNKLSKEIITNLIRLNVADEGKEETKNKLHKIYGTNESWKEVKEELLDYVDTL